MRDFIPVSTPFIGKREKELVLSCLESGWISSEGSYVKEFEKKFSNYLGRKHGVAVSSGTAALDIAVESIGIKKNDEVLVPSFTIISCIHQILRLGATPVFIDSEEDTWNLRADDIQDLITDRTKAIIVPHIYGLPADMDKIIEICIQNSIILIEDSAEMIGQKYKGKMCGSFGQISTFSFYSNKHITTGEGGMIVTDDDSLAQKCRSYRNLCFEPENRFVHKKLGWNYRLTNIQAAIGLAQLERIDFIIKEKRRIGYLYNKYLANHKCIKLPKERMEYAENIYWVYGVLINTFSRGLSIKNVINKLKAKGIGSRPFFYPLHKQPVLKDYIDNYQEINLYVSESLYERGLYLPSSIDLSEEEIKYICNSLKKLVS